MSEKNEGQDGLYTYDSFGKGSSSSNSNFLWWCAGAHQKLLKDHPSEQIKYSGLGGVLLATFALATLSAGYALYSVLDAGVYSIALALVWGLIIFNFDRFLVSTMRKYGVSRSRQLMMAIPRLALAVLIGVTIARPLELKIFEKEVETKMVQNMHERIQQNDSALLAQTAIQLNAAEGERSRLINRRTAIEDTLFSLQNDYVREADGTGGSGRRGIEDLTRLKMNAYQTAAANSSAELALLNTGIKTQDSIIAAARAGMENSRKNFSQTLAKNRGFLEKNKALSDLSAEESSVWWASLMISLLIILIEIGPVLSKLIMPVGPYDIALAREELLNMADEENQIRKGREVAFEKKKAFYQKQREMSETLIDRLSEIQKKQIEVELDKWERGEWSEKDHRASMDEVMKKIKKQYKVDDDSMI